MAHHHHHHHFFKGLNMDGLTGIKEPKKVAKEDDNVPEGGEQPKVIGRRTVIQLYADRMTLPCKNEQLISPHLPKGSVKEGHLLFLLLLFGHGSEVHKTLQLVE